MTAAATHEQAAAAATAASAASSSTVTSCIFGSLGLMSCKSRAEAFARRVHTKLKSIGRVSLDDAENEPEVTEEELQQRLRGGSCENNNGDEFYYDFDLDGSVGDVTMTDNEYQSENVKACCGENGMITRQPLSLMNKSSERSDGDGQENDTSLNLSNFGTPPEFPQSLWSPLNCDESAYCSEAEQCDLEQGQVVSEERESEEEIFSECQDDDEDDPSFPTLQDDSSLCTLHDNPSFQDDDDPVFSTQEQESTSGESMSTASKLVDRFHILQLTDDDEHREDCCRQLKVVVSVASSRSDSPSCDDSDDTKDGDNFLRTPESEVPPPRIMRSSSLKTGKTPPGTPGRKKFVRFADVLGLDLEDVKTICNEEIPYVPQSAFNDLTVQPTTDTTVVMKGNTTEVRAIPHQDMAPMSRSKTLVPMFSQPQSSDVFYNRVRTQKVCLESATLNDMAVRGYVRVFNMDFHKSVQVRYTLNEWRSFFEIEANYVPNSSDGSTDRFSFIIYGSDVLDVGERLVFCVRYSTLGQEFWDNNNGQNYFFQCVADHYSHLPPSPLDSWVHFL